MSTGLDYLIPDWDCKLPSCLKYKADAGTQWFYHNAPYLLLQDVIEAATAQTLQQYTNQRLAVKTGMSGLWFDGVFYSKPRSMARFGLLVLNKGIWAADTIIKDTSYYNQMLNTSQSLNQSYGYLWWLNGKGSYKLPGTTLTFQGKLCPPGPDDMVAALGKNDQKLYIWPSQQLVVVRMGESADSNNLVPVVLDTLIWKEMNLIMCNLHTGVKERQNSDSKVINYFPNPATDKIFFTTHTQPKSFSLGLYDINGRLVLEQFYTPNDLTYEGFLTLDGLRSGLYTIRFTSPDQVYLKKVVIIR